MTVPSTPTRNDYLGTGSTAVYPYGFRIFSSADLVVKTRDTSGVEATLSLGTDYSVSGVGSTTGGNVTLLAGNLATGVALAIRRVLTIQQTTDLENQGPLFAQTVEDALDRATMIALQLQDQLNRAAVVPDTETSIGKLPVKAMRASALFGFDVNGDPIASGGSASVAVSSAMTPVVSATTLALARAAMGPWTDALVAAAGVMAPVVGAASLAVAREAMGPWGDALVAATGSPTARDLQSRFAERFNVKDFGALGDGTTDDTAAVQAAIAAAQVAGGTVYLPLGTYKITDELLVTKDGVRLVGEAVAESLTPGSRIATTSTSKSIIRVSTSLQNISGFEAVNLSLYGAGNGGTAGSGLHFDSTTAGRSILSVRIANLSVKNCKQHGLCFDASVSSAFIFDVSAEKVRTVNNFGSGLRADGSVIEVLVNKIYSEINGASQIAIVGADQTTCPRAWLLNSYVVGSNPAVAGTAGLYLENAFDINAVNVWHESNLNAEFILKSCKGVTINGGRVSQAGTADGLVLGFSGAFAMGNIRVDVPGWANTSSKKRVDLSQFAGGSILLPIYLGQTADGPLTPDQVTGYATAFLADQVFFTAAMTFPRVANIIGNSQAISGTWTVPAGVPKTDVRTAHINSVEQRGYYLGLLAGMAPINATSPLKGVKITRVDVIYSVTGADAGDDFDFLIYRQPWAADNNALPAAVAIASTPDAAHSTAAKRVNSGAAGHQENRATRTVTTPAWLGEGEDLIVIATAIEANDATRALAITINAVLVYYTAANS